MGSSIVLPGQTVIPQGYGKEMVLYSAVNRIEAVVDGAAPGPNGRLFIVEPGKPLKLPFEAGRFILEHMAYTGVVRVLETATDDGITYDMKAAKAESVALTEEMDKQTFHRYVDYVVEDFLKRQKPAPKTPKNIEAIIARRSFNLKQYGIFPLGEKESESAAKMQQLQNDNKALQDQLADLGRKVAAMDDKKAK